MDSLLDQVMPRYDVHERHELWVPASPPDAFGAVKAVSAPEVRLLGPLMRLRMFGRSRRVVDPHAPLIEEMKTIGFVELGERPADELVFGAIGRFWSPTGNMPIRFDDFAAFSEPGYAKAAMNFTVAPRGRRQPHHDRDPRARHRSKGLAQVPPLLARDPAGERCDQAELAEGDPTAARANTSGKRSRGAVTQRSRELGPQRARS